MNPFVPLFYSVTFLLCFLLQTQCYCYPVIMLLLPCYSLISLLTSEARSTVARGSSPARRALCAGGADSLLHVDVRGGAHIVGELNNAEQGKS